MRGTEVDVLSASYAEGVRDERERAERKLAVWRETLQRCVTTADRVRVNFYGVLCSDFGSPDHWPGDREGVVNYRELTAALTAASELLKVNRESK